jgi:hypothetical protein
MGAGKIIQEENNNALFTDQEVLCDGHITVLSEGVTL